MTDQTHRVATAAQERTVFFESGAHQLFGIITEPTQPNGYGMVIIQGGDTVNVSMMRNRMSVDVARRFAAAGYQTIRFDYRGLGESNGELGELDLSSPFAPDAIDAVACLRRETGVEKVFLLGACFSARTALSAAPNIDNIAGLVLSTPPSASFTRSEGSAVRYARDQSVGDFASKAFKLSTLKGLRDPKLRAAYRRLIGAKIRQLFGSATSGRTDPLHWVAPHFLDPLQEMVDRRVPVWICFGVDDAELREFERAEAGRLGDIISGSDGLITVERDMDGIVHGFGTVTSQEDFTVRALRWVSRNTPSD